MCVCVCVCICVCVCVCVCAHMDKCVHIYIHAHMSVCLQVSMAKFSLIDLAGSERATMTANHGERMREGANINCSLAAGSGKLHQRSGQQ